MYSSLNDLITDADILNLAKEHIKKGTVPMYCIGSGKTELATRILTAMMFLTTEGQCTSAING